MTFIRSPTNQQASVTLVQEPLPPLNMQSAVEPASVRRNLKLRLEARVSQLIDEMKKTNLISHENLDLFLSKFLEHDPKNKDEHERISLLFCFLICDVLRPILFAETNRDKQLILEEFDRRLEVLLTETLPPGETVEEFINTYEIFAAEEEIERAQIQRITDCFNEAIKRAYDSANDIDKEIITTFESLKTWLREINSKRKEMTEELQGAIEELSVRVERAIVIGRQVALEQKTIANRMQIDREKFANSAQFLKLILKKV